MVAAYRFPSDDDENVLLSLDQRCAFFESIGAFTYPGTLLEEGPDWPFVTFTINNHAQCELALFTYHALVIRQRELTCTPGFHAADSTPQRTWEWSSPALVDIC